MTKRSPAPANLLHPGLLNYKGPTKGWFLLLNHDTFIEWSDDVRKQVVYVKEEKPENELEIRLRHMLYVPTKLVPMRLKKAEIFYKKVMAKYNKVRQRGFAKAWDARVRASETYYKAEVACSTNKALLAYLHEHVLGCWWDGEKIAFPKNS